MLDAEGLVDLVLDGQPVTVPPRPSGHVVTRLVRVPRHRVLDRAWRRTQKENAGATRVEQNERQTVR